MSLEPPENPNPPPPHLVARGRRVFAEEGCNECHAPPDYTTGGLTLALDFDAPRDHPYAEDILRRTVQTDPGLALKTRKGTGFYKIPSLRGLWYRPRLLHDGALSSLEELFDPARLRKDYEPKGWNPYGMTQRAIPGHRYGLHLEPDDRRALLAFLRSL
jgi:cytochrome c peroxidase